MKKWLANIVKMIGNFFKSLVPKAQSAVTWAIQITDAMKQFDLSAGWAVDIVTTLMPSGVPKAVVEKIRKELPKLMLELRLVDASLKTADPNTIVLEALKVLQNELSDRAWNAFTLSISALLTEVTADGVLDWKDAVKVTQVIYEEKFKK